MYALIYSLGRVLKSSHYIYFKYLTIGFINYMSKMLKQTKQRLSLPQHLYFEPQQTNKQKETTLEVLTKFRLNEDLRSSAG